MPVTSHPLSWWWRSRNPMLLRAFPAHGSPFSRRTRTHITARIRPCVAATRTGRSTHRACTPTLCSPTVGAVTLGCSLQCCVSRSGLTIGGGASGAWDKTHTKPAPRTQVVLHSMSKQRGRGSKKGVTKQRWESSVQVGTQTEFGSTPQQGDPSESGCDPGSGVCQVAQN